MQPVGIREEGQPGPNRSDCQEGLTLIHSWVGKTILVISIMPLE